MSLLNFSRQNDMMTVLLHFSVLMGFVKAKCSLLLHTANKPQQPHFDGSIFNAQVEAALAAASGLVRFRGWARCARSKVFVCIRAINNKQNCWMLTAEVSFGTSWICQPLPRNLRTVLKHFSFLLTRNFSNWIAQSSERHRAKMQAVRQKKRLVCLIYVYFCMIE